jgi:hypothetical protein
MARVCWGSLGFGGARFAQNGTLNGTLEKRGTPVRGESCNHPRMAHHRRRGPKSTRAGCLLCKPHKHQAERHRGRARSDRRWREQQAAADHDGDRDRSDPAK